MKWFLSLIVILSIVLSPSPATAGSDATVYPQIKYPIVRHPKDTGALDVAVIGPYSMLGMRKVADYIDDRLVEFRIHRKRGIRCSDFPNHSLCVYVHVKDYGRTPWAGLAIIDYGHPYWRTIKLNTYYNKNGYHIGQPVAGHEFMHTLGMGHHRQPGLVGTGSPNYPSGVEMDKLKSFY